jgi:oligoribonuclease
MSAIPTIPTKLLWVDLEMTGLDPGKDLILEVVAEITDFNFKKLANYQAFIKQELTAVESLMNQNSWWQSFPANRDMFIANLKNGLSIQQVEQDLDLIISEQFKDEPPILAGNSIYNDRQFIKKWWPKIDQKLHYRMLDVTAFKILMQGKYQIEFQKKELHRAQSDIEESITELQFYLNQLSHNSSDGSVVV